MTMIYLYAITDPLTDAPVGQGLDEVPLELLRADGLAAVYSTHASLDPRPEPDALWRHDLVVEQLMSRGAVLPARFGTTFQDPEALAAAVERQRSGLLERLERVRGCVELAVRVQLPGTDATEPWDGRSYVDAKLAAHRHQEVGATRTLGRLSEHAVASTRRKRGSDEKLLSASYLVRADDVERFADRVRELQRSETELSLSCTGPWAPYSFVGEAE
jgi:hypothetical protein